MTYYWLMALAGAGVGVGVCLLIAALMPTTPHLGDILARTGRDQTTTAWAATPVGRGRLMDRVGASLQARSGGALFATPYRDLDILDMAPARFTGRKVLFALLGFLLPLVVGASWVFLGLGVPLQIPLALSFVLAFAFWFVPDLIVRQQAAVAREEFSRGVTSYIDLVVLSRLFGAGVATAIRRPADLARAPLFSRIRETLSRWALQHRLPWDALRSLADDLDIEPLGELAESMELSQQRGSAIADSLSARARDIRNRYLNQDMAKAQDGLQRQNAACGLLFVALVMYLLIPPLFVIGGG